MITSIAERLMSMARIRELRFAVLAIPFKVAFRHASAERAETSSVWVESVSEGGVVGRGESCPRPYVTGETIDSAQAFFSRHEAALCAHVVDLDSLRSWMAERREELDGNPAAWCAIELAILEMLAMESRVTDRGTPGAAAPGRPVSIYRCARRHEPRGIPGDGRAVSSAGLHGFQGQTVRQPGPRPRKDRRCFASGRASGSGWMPTTYGGRPTRPSRFCRRSTIRSPRWKSRSRRVIRRARPHRGAARVQDDPGRELPARIADRPAAGDPDAWIINLRVSKMGGLLRSLEVARAARNANVGLIVGAQVGETSVLTRAALAVAHASRDILVAQEGAFGTLLLERDVCDPPLIFGAGGVLDVAAYPALERPGFGLTG